MCDEVQGTTSNDVVSEGRAVLDKLFQGIHAENFKPTVSALCHWCEYNPLVNPSIIETNPAAVCPYFSTWEKSGDDVKNTLVTWQDLASVEVDRQLCISQIQQLQKN